MGVSSTNARTSNTDQVSSTNRSVVGSQPDGTSAGGETSGGIPNDQLAAMPANTVKANPTNASSTPADVAMPASSFLARLAAGNIVAATVAQVKTLLAYVIGDLGNIAAGSLVGNNTGGGAAPAALNAGQAATLLAGGSPFSGSVTAALAKLTVTGTNGSLQITVNNGLVTALVYVAPT